MDTTTIYSGQIHQRNIPAIFLQHGSPNSIAVSSASVGTVGVSLIESSFSTASATKLEFEAIHQAPLNGNSTDLALFEFSKKMSKEKEVVAVTFEKENEIIRIWTFIEKRDKQVRRAIYIRELELMDAFTNLIFDFNVVSREGVKMKPFIPADLQGYLVFYRKN
jgi:hypothetical protein